MAEEIRKESGREYGVHMGKPPTALISGSGREFYYSQGALALVAEVGSRNISDYVENMTESINENIPALLYALGEAPNYQKEVSLLRVDDFIASSISSKEVELTWSNTQKEDVYFELFRSKKEKGFAQASNRIAITKSTSYTDKNLKPSTNYFYYLRAVCKNKKIKSPFAQLVSIRTNPANGMFSKILYPLVDKIGYVGEKTKKNKDHFGVNSMFVGISEAKGECFGVSVFSLSTIPENAVITEASLSFYPMNRVSVQIEKFGQWRVGQMDDRNIDNISNFDEIKEAKMLSFIGKPTLSSQLSQGIWRRYGFAAQEIAVLQKSLKRREAYFRMEGPQSLPLDRSSQLMQWDIGYGEFSGGLTFRPKLDIAYTIENSKIDIQSSYECSVSEEGTLKQTLISGYDKNAKHQYACIEFDLSNLPDMDNTSISDAYIDLEVNKIDALNDIRFHLEMIVPSSGEKNFESVTNRNIIERIGYDVSVADLKNSSNQRFIFDTYAVNEMINSSQNGMKIEFVISASSQKDFSKSQNVKWMDSKRVKRPSLIIQYIKKRKNAPEQVQDLTYKIENGISKLSWKNPDDDGFRGVIVIKNPFRIPCSPYDGQKLYGGSDNYTLDNFGSQKVHKYYAVFSYDDVPNFSKPVYIEVNENNK
ncbi:MAG: fibronectin type III domain-containing protein [Sulfurimonas sp.]|nr:fibronectin type III domain-containing protein [Sulfurimonas sp.]